MELQSIINKWLVANKICINTNKTRYMLFSYKRDITLPIIKIGHHKIHEVEYTKFLGIYFDKRIKFDHQIKHINTKLSKSIEILYKIYKYLPKIL